MTAGMADVITAHQAVWECMGGYEDDRAWLECSCRDSIKNDIDNWTGDTETEHAAHVAEELAKAGYGNAQEVLLSAADEMPIETLGGADKASLWLRQRAHSLDSEGRALVQAIHDRKAGT